MNDSAAHDKVAASAPVQEAAGTLPRPPPSPRKPIFRRRKLYEEIADHLEAEIARGRWRVGEQLPSEREFMDQLGVGRSAVREALFALDKMGLVATASGERARVTRPTPEILIEQLGGAARRFLRDEQGVRDFQQARAVLEAGAARLAARHADERAIRRLGELLEVNRRALDDEEAFVGSDIAFHLALSEMTGNAIFPALHDAIVAWLTEQRRVSARLASARAAAFAWHERIHAAIAAGDEAAAEAAMRAHLEDVAARYWQARVPTPPSKVERES